MVHRRNLRNAALFLVLIIGVLLIALMKAPKQYEENFTNSDATWHLLLTVKAMQDTPISEHKMLPLVNLGAADDKGLRWGATVSDRHGNMIYTSFMPLTFVIPYLIFTIVNLPIAEASVYWMATLISIFCFCLFVRFWYVIFKGKLSFWFVAVTSCLIYFFLPEMLHSSMTFWGQSLFQLTFLLQLNTYVSLLQKPSRAKYVFFAVFCFLSPSVEWTGFIGNVGFCICILINNNSFIDSHTDSRRISHDKVRYAHKISLSQQILQIVIVVASTLLSAAAFIGHFLLSLEPDVFFTALKERFFERSTNAGRIGALFKSYWGSFHYFLIILFVLIIIAGVKLFASSSNKKVSRMQLSMFILLACPLLENVLMLQHATLYTYDRQKGVFLCSFIFFSCCQAIFSAVSKKHTMLAVFISIVLVCLGGFNYLSYLNGKPFGNQVYRWAVNYGPTEALAKKLNSEFPPKDSIMISEYAVRGWTNLLFDRGIYEGDSAYQALLTKAWAQRKTYLITVYPVCENWNKDKYENAVIYDLLSDSVFVVSYEAHSDIIKYHDGCMIPLQRVDVAKDELAFPRNDITEKIIATAEQISSDKKNARIADVTYDLRCIYVKLESPTDMHFFSYPEIVSFS